MGYFWVVKWLKVAFDFYIRSSLHVAVCYTALAMVVIGRYHIIEENLWFGIMQFCLVVTAYNFVKYFELARNKSAFRFKTPIVILTIVTTVFSGILLLPELTYIYPYIIALSALVLVYVYPSITSKNFRHYAFLKLPIVGLCWVLFIASYGHSEVIVRQAIEDINILNCNYYPAYQMIFNDYFYLSLIGYFFFILALCIPFEIRDLKHDNAELKTIPQVIGVRKTKWLGILLTVLSWYFLYRFNSQFYFTFTLLFIHLILGLAIWFSDRFKSDYYASFFVEAIPVLWLVMLLFF